MDKVEHCERCGAPDYVEYCECDEICDDCGEYFEFCDCDLTGEV